MIDLPSHPTIKGTIVALLGADDNGIPLEIIVREDRSGGLSISDMPGTHSPRMATRVSPRVKQLFAEKAATEGETPSRVMRRLVEEYVGVQSSSRATRRPRRPSRGSAA